MCDALRSKDSPLLDKTVNKINVNETFYIILVLSLISICIEAIKRDNPVLPRVNCPN